MSDREIGERVTRLEERIDRLEKLGEKILHALEGSPLEGKKGLVHQIEDAVKELDKFKKIGMILIVSSGIGGASFGKILSALI